MDESKQPMWAIIMKKITTVIKMAFISFAMAAGTVVAQPVVYTLSPVKLANGSNINGTVTFDATLPPVGRFTAFNLTVTGTHAGAYNFVGPGVTTKGIAQKTATVNIDDKIIEVQTGFSPTPGQTRSIQIQIGNCSAVADGQCSSYGFFNEETGFGLFTTPASGIPRPIPTPIPTLGQWGMIFLASLMAMLAMRRVRRQP